MLVHYIKIAFRNIWKYKTQSLTGIFGLAFGLACLVPALYWMRYETTYDSSYPDADRLYRVYAMEKSSGKVSELVPIILSKKLSEQVPAVEAATVFMAESNNCKTETVPHISLRTLTTNNSFFGVFPQEFVSGDTQQPLLLLHNIVLTESMAIRLFGDVESAIGKQIQSTYYFFNPPYTVTAVVKDPPENTNLSFDALLNHDMLTGMLEMEEQFQWIQYASQVYVKFYPHTDTGRLGEELCDFISQSGGSENSDMGIMPITNVRHQLSSNIFTLNFIRLFVAAGILLLFSALFNFMNLYLDLFRQRIQEFRQRTVHGAKSRQLIRQMLFELSCSILLALLLGGGLVFLVRPVFPRLLDLTMDGSALITLFTGCGIGLMLLMLLIGLITFWRLGRLAMQPLSKEAKNGQPLLRRVAVTLQIAVSVVFIVAALVVMLQMHFVDRKDMGFDRAGIIQLYGLPPYMEGSLRTALIQGLKTIPQIENITTSNFEPLHSAKTEALISYVDWPGRSTEERPVFNIIPVDSHFADIFGLKIVAGEWWSKSDNGGMQKVVLNEEAIRVMGLSDPVGTIIRLSMDNVDLDIAELETEAEYQVVGVVNDFHTLSLRSPIIPTILRQSIPLNARIVTENILYLHVMPGQEQEVMQRIRTALPAIDPTFAELRLTTLDELYDNFNQSEQVGLKMFSVLATVCLLISLFGIYAVAAAAAQRRRKEIAIRKVMGAKAGDIVRMFFREYILQVIIAGAFALPLAYLVMSRWLQGYAYRTNIPWWLLAGVIVSVVAVVLFTVWGQVWKAGSSNPAEVVKSE